MCSYKFLHASHGSTLHGSCRSCLCQITSHTHAPVQELEEKHSSEALDVAQTNLVAAHDQISQLHTQLQQALANCASISHAEAQVSQLQAQLQQQQAASAAQATAVAALTEGFDQERGSWQTERQSLLGRAKVIDAHALLEGELN